VARTSNPVSVLTPRSTPGTHTHARRTEIRDNLIARVAEAEREGWLGEVEGLQTSLAHAEQKLTQLDAEQNRRQQAVDLGMPTFGQIAARTVADVTPPQSGHRPGGEPA
jgi:hypothetical protein